MKKSVIVLIVLVLSLAFTLTAASTVSANHAWGNYHWARSSNPVNLEVGDNLTGPWSAHLSVAISDWNSSSMLSLAHAAGQARGQCRPTAGRIEACNAFYGNNGWLGIAQIWVSGEHITQATTKVNDTYFSAPPYNTPEWRQFVMCQEIGHDFGLGHQDENFDDPPMGTCMDYTSDPGPNQHPDQHDYQQLEAIYSHLDGGGSEPCRGGPKQCGDNGNGNGNNGLAGSDLNTPGEWGQLVRSQGRVAIYERDFGASHRVVTFVIWAS
jgi:hypothetical protein